MIEEKIKKIVSTSDYLKGKRINPMSILPQKILTISGNDKILKYKVQSANSDNIYTVTFILKDGDIISSNCTCPMCEKTRSCKHVAAVLINKSSDLFKEEKKDNSSLDISSAILDKLYHKKTFKQELKLELELHFEFSHYSHGISVFLKVGINTMYKVGSKISSFLHAYRNKASSVIFGKEFTYDANTQQFNEEDAKIMDFLCDMFYFSEYTALSSCIYVKGNYVDKFMLLLKNKTFNVAPVYLFNGVIEASPLPAHLQKDGDTYTFSLDYDYLNFADYNQKYLIYTNKLYKIPDSLSELLKLFTLYQTKQINFSKDDIPNLCHRLVMYLKMQISMLI